MVDYETVAAGDKFGNIFLNRLPKGVSHDVDDDPTGAGILHEKPYLMGAPHRTELICHYHVGDIVTSLQKASLVAGGRDLLLYTGLLGTVGVLIPFVSTEDVDFFTTLEMHLRSEAPSLCGKWGSPCRSHGRLRLTLLAFSAGREHLAYRSAYTPVKAVVDGDLCEAFRTLPMTKQAQIAQELERSVAEVTKKLDNIRATAW